MVITYYGEGCFRLQSGELSLLLDPSNSRLKADVVLKTLASTTTVEPEIISFPGEYEAKGIEIQGVGVPEESTDKFVKTVYGVKFEDMNILFLGHLSNMPDMKLFERFEEPDVLFIPTGAEHFMSADEAAKVARQLEPAIVIPSFYKDTDKFMKAMGQKGEPEEKLVFKKKDLGQGQRVVVLKAQ